MSARSIGYAGTVDHVERMKSSRNGNPRYRVHLTDGRTFPTAPDAQWGYAADNAEWRQQVCWFALEPCRLKSDAWQISYARGMWPIADGDTSPCVHCVREIVADGDAWVDPAADGDDVIWRETCEAHDTFAATHEPTPRERVWFVWHGGPNYSPSGAGDAETADRASDVVDVVNSRYWSRDGYTPGVTDESEAWIYAADPSGSDDPYPDMIVRRADGGEGGDGWHTWTVSPI